MNTIVTSPDLASLEAEFVGSVGRAKAADALAPLTIVVGSNLQHTYLRRRLARAYGAVANVRFLTLLDLAGEVHLAMPDDPAMRPLPPGSEALIVRVVTRRAGSGTGLPIDVHGMAEAIAATVRDLREAGLEPDALDAYSARSNI